MFFVDCLFLFLCSKCSFVFDAVVVVFFFLTHTFNC